MNQDAQARIQKLVLSGLSSTTEAGLRDALERIGLVAGLEESQLPPRRGVEMQRLRVPGGTVSLPVFPSPRSANHYEAADVLGYAQALLRIVDEMLTIPAAEHVPAIRDVFLLVDAVAQMRTEPRPDVATFTRDLAVTGGAAESEEPVGADAWVPKAGPDKGLLQSIGLRGPDATSLAEAIHYPGCWDTAAYPTLAAALGELAAAFRCSNADCPAVNPERLAAWKATTSIRRDWLWTYDLVGGPTLRFYAQHTNPDAGYEIEQGLAASGEAAAWLDAKHGEGKWAALSLHGTRVSPFAKIVDAPVYKMPDFSQPVKMEDMPQEFRDRVAQGLASGELQVGGKN